MLAVKGLESMEKWLCWVSLAVSGLMLVLFGLDLALSFPWGKGITAATDIVVLIAAALLGYLSWNALRDLR